MNSEPDLRLIRSFVMVAQERSFTRAAAQLGMSQPTLSSQIIRLEDTLGFPLFERSTRRVSLTREGTELLGSAAKVMAQLTALKDDIRRLQLSSSRSLRIGAGFFTTEIPERNALLQDFAEAHDHVRLSVHDAAQSELITAVAQGRLDGAILVGAGVDDSVYFNPTRGFYAEGTFPQSWRRHVIGVKPIELLVPRESPLAAFDAIPAEALRRMPVAAIDPEQGPGPLGKVKSWLEDAGAEIILPFESRHAMAVERFAMRRRIACVSLCWFQESAEHQTMVRRPMAGIDCATELIILMKPGVEMRPLQSAFATFVKNWGQA